MKDTDEEESNKYLQKANLCMKNNEIVKAKLFYEDSLRFNLKNEEALNGLLQIYTKEENKYDEFCIRVIQQSILSGEENQLKEKTIDSFN